MTMRREIDRDVFVHAESGVEITANAYERYAREGRLDALLDHVATEAYRKGTTMPTNQWNNSLDWHGATNVTASGTMGYPNATVGYQPVRQWHTFQPCGHQIELALGQPIPQVCQICGPVKMPEYDRHEYAKCGHVHSFPKGGYLSPTCPTCDAEERERAKVRAQEAQAAEEARQRRLAEDREPVAWLDKQVSDVCAAGVV